MSLEQAEELASEIEELEEVHSCTAAWDATSDYKDAYVLYVTAKKGQLYPARTAVKAHLSGHNTFIDCRRTGKVCEDDEGRPIFHQTLLPKEQTEGGSSTKEEPEEEPKEEPKEEPEEA